MKLKAKVLYPFYDSEAKTNRKTNDVFEVTAKRFNEICRKGRYVELVEEESETTATKKTEK